LAKDKGASSAQTLHTSLQPLSCAASWSKPKREIRRQLEKYTDFNMLNMFEYQ
jgi:hypothetical protein